MTFQQLKYGWLALAGIVVTGTTIYVAVNTRHRVQQIDIIELALGVAERCLATQYATNPATYRVAPPEFVRTWTTTNGLTGANFGWTNIVVTNAIGWRVDYVMMTNLDAKIKTLIPYYIDTNFPLTNMVMLTVTGLWASLGIGDHTNKFTRTPEWIGTNGVTNVATYGEYPWQIYVEDLQERYKVLHALQWTWNDALATTGSYRQVIKNSGGSWASNRAMVMADYLIVTNHSYMATDARSETQQSSPLWYAMMQNWCVWYSMVVNSNVAHLVELYSEATVRTYMGCTSVFDAQNYGATNVFEGVFLLYSNTVSETNGSYTGFIGSTNFNVLAPWCDEPVPGGNDQIRGWKLCWYGNFVDDYMVGRGLIKWQFAYCTNKFW